MLIWYSTVEECDSPRRTQRKTVDSSTKAGVIKKSDNRRLIFFTLVADNNLYVQQRTIHHFTGS